MPDAEIWVPKEGEPIPPVDPVHLKRRWNIKLLFDDEAAIVAEVEFLCYYRVIESATKSNGTTWIASSLGALSVHNFGRITIGHGGIRSRNRNLLSIWRSRALQRLSVLRKRFGSADAIATYLYSTNRCGIAHGRTIVRADILPSYFEVVRDTYVLKLLARLAIDQKV